MSNNLFDCVFDRLSSTGSRWFDVGAGNSAGRELKIPLIVLTGHGNEEVAVDMMKAGASDYLSKFRLTS
jgi:DNA-binding NtrC family response regulator